MSNSARALSSRELLPYCAAYVGIFGALGCILPYWPTVLSAQGMTEDQIGWVMAVFPASQLIHPLWWAALADQSRLRGRWLRIAMLGSAVGVPLLFLPMAFSTKLIVAAAVCVFISPVIALADTVTNSAIAPQFERFAIVRVWGSVSFAAVAFGLGMLVPEHGTIYFAVLASGAYLVGAVPSYSRSNGKARRTHTRVQFDALFATLAWARTNATMRLTLLGATLYYAAHAIFDAFIGLRVHELGQSNELIGMIWLVAVGAEIATMAFATSVLKAIGAPRALLLCALISIVRWVAIAYTANRELLLVYQLLHGATFGLWYVASVELVNVVAPEATRGSAQAVFAAATSFGTLHGYVWGGLTFRAWGGRVVFLAAACIAGLSAAIYSRLNRSSMN